MQSHEFDVVVVGGGTAGAIAAIGAARMGAHTCVIEKGGYLGGTCHELANVTPFHNTRGEQIVRGLPQVLVDRIGANEGTHEEGHLPNPTGIGGSFTPIDPDAMKLALFDMAREARVEVWLHTMFVTADAPDAHLRGVRVFNKSGGHEVRGHVFIDATGDADVVASIGAGYEQDVPEAALNATLLFRIAGVDTRTFIEDVRLSPHKIVLLADPFLRERRALEPRRVMDQDVRDIYDCPYIYLANLVRDYVPRKDWGEWGIRGEDKSKWGRLQPFASRFSIMPAAKRSDVVTVNATSITFDATHGGALSHAEMEGRRQLQMALTVLRRYVPGFQGSFLHGTSPFVSIRASRRMRGEYMLTREDIQARRRFGDAIARGAYPMSVQSPDQPGMRQHLFVPDGGDYDIPYRCLVPERVEGLLVAGRCLSASREAIGSARMGAQCMAYGHAAGVAAALVAQSRSEPRAVSVSHLRRELIAQGAIL